MLVSAVFLSLQAAAAADEADPYQDRRLIVREQVEPFEVPGRNYRAFYRNVDRYGPNGRFGQFGYRLDYGFYAQMRGELCRAESEEVVIDLTYRLPAWTHYEQANTREREAFDEMYASQRAFLEVYGEVVRRGGYGLLQDLRSLDDMPCDQLEASMEAVGEAWLEAIEEVVARHEDNAGTVPLADTVCRTTGTRLPRCRT
ncbi:MAG: DUF922 domain-containing protein [Oceanicaulis sp.]